MTSRFAFGRHCGLRRVHCAAAVGLAVFGASPAAWATEGGGTSYPLGVGTINPGLEPSPPGFTFLNYNAYYNASHTRNSQGGDALPGYHVQLYVETLRFDYTLPDGILPPGWRAGVGIVQPIFDTELYFRPGRVGQKYSTFGLGDTTILPLIVGYQAQSALLGRYAAKFKMAVALPDGDYNRAVALNKGRNYLALEPQIGLQWFPRKDFSIGANFNYIYNFKNSANNYKSGQEFILEPIAEYSPTPGWWFGVQGYVFQQLTRDTVNSRPFRDGNFSSTVAVGPQVRYATERFGLAAKWQHEMLARNRPDGERFWLQLYLPL